MVKKARHDVLDRDKYDWICVSKDEEVSDGVMIDKDERQKFEKELQLDKYTIYDYIKELEQFRLQIKKLNGYVCELEKQVTYLTVQQNKSMLNKILSILKGNKLYK